MTVQYGERPARPQVPRQEAAFHQWIFPSGTLWTQFFRQGSSYLLRFPGLADFEMSPDGRSVQGWPAPGVTGPTVEHLYLNQVLPLALSRQGRLVLHGSAVEVTGAGIAFLGASGRGKSTLAAAFATTGCRFLTDDGLHLTWVDQQCLVLPSHPSIRLWQDSQTELIKGPVESAGTVGYSSKARLLAGDHVAFCDVPQVLRRVYFLGGGDATDVIIEPMRPAQAMVELVHNSFLLDIEEREVIAAHFEELTRLAALPIYFRLDYPRRFKDVPRVRETIIQHANEEMQIT